MTGPAGVHWSRRLLRSPWCILCYLGLALVVTAPVVEQPLSRIAVGAESAGTVPLFNLWTIWWNVDRLGVAGRGYWNAPIFFPARDTFAYSEPQPITALLAPVMWLTESRTLTCACYLWLMLTLNGFVARRLLRTLRVRNGVAFVGGALFVLLPIVHWQLGVLQLVSLWPVLLCCDALLRIARARRMVDGVQLGIGFVLGVFSCVHHALFLSILLAIVSVPCGIVFVCRLKNRAGRRGIVPILLVAALIAAPGTLPILLKLRAVTQAHGFQRSMSLVEKLSATSLDFTATYSAIHRFAGLTLSGRDWYLSPGWSVCVLAVFGAIHGLNRQSRRSATIGILLFGGSGFVLALGMNLHWGNHALWPWLVDVVPGLSTVRSVYRFAFFFQSACVVLAVQGLQGLQVWARRSTGPLRWTRWTPRLRTLVTCGIGGLMLVEVWPPEPAVVTVPDVSRHGDWIDFVRSGTKSGRSLACLPFARGDRVELFQVTAEWMFLGTFHGVPLVNGYSGFFPEQYFALRDEVNECFPTESLLLKFEQAGVQYVAVMPHLFSPETMAMARFPSIELMPVFESRGGVRLYELRRTDRPSASR